jgi:crotonobetainyl-CoA:carnitine CoA-transferase CaiB-like acyl-CoA transferase
MPGEHTREICQKLLSMDADETDRLIADSVLFTHQGRSN